MKKLYTLNLDDNLLVLHNNLLHMATSIMSNDVEAVIQSKQAITSTMELVGIEPFKAHTKVVNKLIEEMRKDNKDFVPYTNPQFSLHEIIAKIFDIAEEETSACCGHPPAGAETDPLCDHCGQRHP